MKTPPFSGFLQNRFPNPHLTIVQLVNIPYNDKEKKTLT